MLLFGTFVDWLALAAVIASSILYLVAGGSRKRLAIAARIAFIVAAAAIVAAVAALGTLLVTHRFDSAYVYAHTAKAMAPLYWFPSMWAGQEGSFLLWAFWTAAIGVVLAFTARSAECRVMPIYNGMLIFLTAMLVVRSPFLPLDTHGMPVPSEGLGLNPNLENPWMVIHPPTLFLGFSALGVPFAYALMALLWRDGTVWLRRALPWGLFGFAVIGLAMMMGGYWAYEMLGWGGFWGWDPVENGPLVPWLCLLAFLHSAQVQRARGGLVGATLILAMLPFVTGLYETFLTRTGILEKFSVHSFSTLGGVGNDMLLYFLIGATLIMLVALIGRRHALRSDINVWDVPGSREFGYLLATILITLCALIAALGMSAPLLCTLGEKLHLTNHLATVEEDFYNRATFPIAVLLSIGMGVTPLLVWRESKIDRRKLMRLCAASIAAAALFGVARLYSGSTVGGYPLAAQALLFTTSAFALIANCSVLFRRARMRTSPADDGEASPNIEADHQPARDADRRPRHGSVGGIIAHIGAAIFLMGIACLVALVRKDPDILLPQGQSRSILGGAYSIRYAGQTSSYATDRNNALTFVVTSRDGHDRFTVLLPFALRAVAGGEKQIFSHPAIAHRMAGDLYFALKDGPTEIYSTPVHKLAIPVGATIHNGPYAVQFIRFERDPHAAAIVQATGQLPARFPLTAVLRVTYHGVSTIVRPVFVLHSDAPNLPDTPEIKLPGGWLATFQGMDADSSDSGAVAADEIGKFTMRADSGPPKEAFDLQITTRPMIGLVWAGTLLMVLGGLTGMCRRIAEARADEEQQPDLQIPASMKLARSDADMKSKLLAPKQ